MKHIILISLALLIALPSMSQEMSAKEKRQQNKELKKEQQAEEAAKKAEIIKVMVEYQRFVLEADRLRDKRGNQVNVSATINFVAIDSTSSVIQIGSNQYVGQNGVGGITIEGRVSGYKYDYNEKNGSYTVSWYVRSTTGTYDVNMSISADGRTDARITSTWPGQLNYMGYVVPVPLSKVYKGTSLY